MLNGVDDNMPEDNDVDYEQWDDDEEDDTDDDEEEESDEDY